MQIKKITVYCENSIKRGCKWKRGGIKGSKRERMREIMLKSGVKWSKMEK
jgi:hypothetical protein